jgi:hypothetical protein
LVCFKLTTRSCARFSFKLATDPPAFLLRLSVFGASTLIQSLYSFFGITLLDFESPQTQQQFISSLPRFLFIYLGRDVWNFDHIEKDCRSIAAPVMLDMTPSGFQQGTRYQYQLAAVISHLGVPEEWLCRFITFVNILVSNFDLMTLMSKLLMNWQHSKTTSRRLTARLKLPLSSSTCYTNDQAFS